MYVSTQSMCCTAGPKQKEHLQYTRKWDVVIKWHVRLYSPRLLCSIETPYLLQLPAPTQFVVFLFWPKSVHTVASDAADITQVNAAYRKGCLFSLNFSLSCEMFSPSAASETDLTHARISGSHVGKKGSEVVALFVFQTGFVPSP